MTRVPLDWDVALKLGRVSNLPTVWTNTLAALVLSGAAPDAPRTWPLLAAMSLFYIGGMYLNDAFDAEIDARERPERPIPSGRIARNTVFALGFAMLGLGLALLLWIGLVYGGGLWPPAGGLLLAGCIVFYDYHHKRNPLSPVVMGLCRVLVYLTAALCVAQPPPAPVWLGAALLLAYLIGLTYIAKQENLQRMENLWPLAPLAAPLLYGVYALWQGSTAALPYWLWLSGWVAFALYYLKRRRRGDIPRAVVSLIAGISLLDALLIAAAGAPGWALLAVLGFILTLMLQRYIPGT